MTPSKLAITYSEQIPHHTSFHTKQTKDNIFKAQTQHALRNRSLYIEDAKD
jgi:hypothetical protein